MSVKAHVEHNWANDDLRLYIKRWEGWRGAATVSYVSGFIWSEAKPGDDIKPVHIDTREMREDNVSLCQALLDALWASGLRPLGYQDTRESVAALNRHLEDMRAIAFHGVKVEKPK